MSNQREQFSRWALTQVIHPPRTRKFVICVPDERFYIAAFRGLLIELTYSKNWQRDTAHTAAVVSRVWQAALESVLCDDCLIPGIVESDDDMQFRIKPDDPCIIQTLCGDGTWLDWYDPRGCIPGSVSQPAPGGDVPVGECRSYDVKLDGNGLWKLPVSVQAGDTITITAADGGWHDGTLTTWRCANGEPYGLGMCGGATITDSGDPLPAEPHMILIASYGQGPTYEVAYNATITIPDGTPASDLVFQANDGDLTDNSGSISFHVEYCRSNVNQWCAAWNATNGWTGFTGTAQYGCAPTLTAGVWDSCLNSYPYQGSLITGTFVLPSGTTINRIVLTANTTDTNAGSNGIDITDLNGGSFSKHAPGPGTPQVIDYPGVVITGTATINAIANGASGSPTQILQVKVYGEGPTPSWAVGMDC